MAGVLSLNGRPQAVLDADGALSLVGTGSAGAGASTQRVMKLLGALLRIKISDGRVVVGTFHCFDKHQNVILTDTREYAPLHRTVVKKGGKDKAKAHQDNSEAKVEDEADSSWLTGPGRSLGMTLVPGKHIVYIKVEPGAYERTN